LKSLPTKFPLLQGEGSDKTKRESECRGKNQKDKWRKVADKKKDSMYIIGSKSKGWTCVEVFSWYYL